MTESVVVDRIVHIMYSELNEVKRKGGVDLNSSNLHIFLQLADFM